MRRSLLALLAALTARAAVVAGAEEPAEPPACVIPALVVGTDAGDWATYDGIRRGLEEASLPRVCRVDLPPAPEADPIVAALRAKPPVAFAVGPEACARLAHALRYIPATNRPPCVYVRARGPARDAEAPPLPCAVVEATVPPGRWDEALAGLFPGKDRPQLFVLGTASGTGGDLAARTTRGSLVRQGPADARVDWGDDGKGARREELPLLSSDRGRFGNGAAAVVTVDHPRLGRAAADAARRLLTEGAGRDRPLEVAFTAAEIWVDLEVCDRAGLRPPLTFLASVDRLRRAPPKAEPSK